MDDAVDETILLICDDEVRAERLLAAFDEAQIGVIGPFTTAGLAFAMTAHTAAIVALLVSWPAGRRKAEHLALTLQDNWGARAMLLDEAAHVSVKTVGWRAPDDQVARVSGALFKAFSLA